MLKRGILFVLLLLLVPTMLALEINIKDSYSSGENVLATVSGNFIDPVLLKNIYLYQDHFVVSSDFSLINVDGVYYIETDLLDKKAGNYSIHIEDASYLEGRNVNTSDIIIPFKISNQTADFVVFTGIVVTNGTFYAQVQNLKSSTISLSISGAKDTLFFPDGQTFSIKSGEVKKIKLTAKEIKINTLENLAFKTSAQEYTLPVYVMGTYVGIKEKERNFELDPASLKLSLYTNKNQTQIVYLVNTGEEDLENISIFASESIKNITQISIEKISLLEKTSTQKIEITFLPEFAENLTGQITARAQPDLFTYVGVELNVVNEFQYNNGTVPSKENQTTPLIEDDTSSSWSASTWGWIIIIAIVALLAWFYFFKYRRGPEKFNANFLDKFKNKEPEKK